MVSNFNAIISKIKNGYRNGRPDLCIKNFLRSETVLQKLRDDGFIRGFSIIDKKTLRIFLSYTKNKTPALTAAIPLSSIHKKNPVGFFNVTHISRDFNVPYVIDSIQNLYSLRSKKSEYKKISQGVFLLK
jgi:ribosomal protein S8